MRMKKALAVLAAISMLAAVGIPAGAEEVSTETEETATEAVTTTVPESVIVGGLEDVTIATVTMGPIDISTSTYPTIDGNVDTTPVDVTTETETTTVTTSSTGTELSRATFTLNGVELTAVLSEEAWNGTSADLNYLLTIYDGTSATNLSNVIVGIKSDSTEVTDYFSVSGNTIRISTYSGAAVQTTIYEYVNGAFVEAGTTATTTTTSEETDATIIELRQGDTFTVSGTLSYEIDHNRPILKLDSPITVCYYDSDTDTDGYTQDFTYVRINDENLTYADGTRMTVTGTVEEWHAGSSSGNVLFLNDCIISATETEGLTQVDEETVSQGGHTYKFVLYKDDSGAHFLNVYVDGVLKIAQQAVGNFSWSKDYISGADPDDVDYYTGIGEDSVLTITDYYGTQSSFHRLYSEAEGDFVDYDACRDRYYKFVAEYGEPDSIDYGDFNGDGSVEAYAQIMSADGTSLFTYYVTKDGITYIGEAGDSMGQNDFFYFSCKGYKFRANLRTSLRAALSTGSITIERIESDGTLTPVTFNGGSSVLYDTYETGGTPNYRADLTDDQAVDADSYISASGDTITVTHYNYENGRDVGSAYYTYDATQNAFVETSAVTPDDNKTFTVEIPYTYFTIIDSVTGEVITTPGANKSMVSATATECTNGNVVSFNKEAFQSGVDSFITSVTVSDVKPGTLTIKGTCDSYSSLSEELREAGYITFPHEGDGISSYFTLTVTIDENGNIVSGSSDGKTDGGSSNSGSSSSTSSKTSTSNTSNTPKTGDIATVPAVAVGLTLTAAGVVALIYKKRK